MKKLYLDSNIYISVLSSEPVTPKVVALLEQADLGKHAIISSVIIYGEVFKAEDNSKNTVLQFLDTVPVAYVHVDKEIIINASLYRQKHTSLKLPDAIHLATAIQQGCDEFISQDKQLLKIAKLYLKAHSV